jgi:CheY-like chemotaxis protein
MDGFEATRRIRHMEAENSLTPAHIVALTGLASDRDEDEAYDAGVDKFITKPVQFDKLKHVLTEQGANRSKETG